LRENVLLKKDDGAVL